MRRLVLVAALACGQAWAASPVAVPAVDPAVAAAQADFEANDQDYAAAAALGRAAAAAESWALALLAWDRAFVLSRGNAEAGMGRVLALLGADRVHDAQTAARALVAAFPDRADLHAVRAWTLRQDPTGYGLRAALAAYARAAALGGVPDLDCGRAWTWLSLGDRLGAARRFAALDSPCASAGSAASKPTLAADLGAWGAVLGYQDDADDRVGLAFVLDGGVEVADLLWLRGTGRFLWKDPGDADTTTRYQQQELWGRFGAGHAGFGAEALVGVLHGSTLTADPWALGGRAWFGPVVTPRLDGVFSRHPDGDAWQLGVGVELPATSWLSFDVRGQLSRWIGTTADPVLGSLGATATATHRALRVTVGGWGGPRARPFDWSRVALWNVSDRAMAGATLDLALTPVRGLTLSTGYEVLRFETGAHTHIVHLGVRIAERGVPHAHPSAPAAARRAGAGGEPD